MSAYSAYSYIKSQIPNTAFIIEKNSNRNVVVYEGKLFHDSKDGDIINPVEPIDIYWMDIDPAYQRRARASGKMDDRVPLSFIEKNIVYGVQFKEGTNPNQYYLELAACTKRPLLFYYDPRYKEFIVETTIAGKRCQLTSIFAHTLNDIVVQSVDLHGMCLDTLETVVENIAHP